MYISMLDTALTGASVSHAPPPISCKDQVTSRRSRNSCTQIKRNGGLGQ